MSSSSPPSSPPQGGAPVSHAASWHAMLCATARDWYTSEGPIWVYIGKAVLAGLLCLFIAMRLELPSPRTALVTVFIVMTPQSGMVFAKSFYRIIGTISGLIAMLTMISLFSQAHLLFLLSLAIWIGICTAGSARNRNFRSYGFLLAGYTAALIGVTNAEAPLGAFDAAVTRVIEVSLGIICAGVVSALVFPRHSSDLLQTQVKNRFGSFVELVRDAAYGKLDRTGMQKRNMQFIADVVGLEALRTYSIFEDPLLRMRSGRLARLNTESMAASTRFHALHQLLLRVHKQGGAVIVDTITPYLHALGEHLMLAGKPVLNAHDAAQVSAQLADYRTGLPRQLRNAREQAINGLPEPLQRDFETASELLYRFVDELHAYASTYASLNKHVNAREQWKWSYAPKTNAWMAAIAGGRAALTLLLVSAFWILSDWPSGDFATLIAGTICALISASPQPARAAVQMTIGALLAALAGYIVTFHVFAYRDGFMEMASGLAPFLMFGAWLTTRRKGMAAGMGYCIFFCFLAGPDNANAYDAVTYLNNAVALMAAMLISAASFGVLLPPTSRWLLRKMATDLRRQVGFAASGKLSALAHRFDHQTRDFMFQIAGLTSENVTLQREMLDWMLSVLEIGHAVIELRLEFQHLPDARHTHPDYRPDSAWRTSLREVGKDLSALFASPSKDRWQKAFTSTLQAMETTQTMLNAVQIAHSEDAADVRTQTNDQRYRMRRVLSYLHFIRSALLDEQSPLFVYAGIDASDAMPPPSPRPHETPGDVKDMPQ